MKYSVLMSVYKNDNPDFLETALESIYEKQTRRPDEIVVVFDGELTSELYAVLYKFRENKENTVYYYPQKINQGLGQALRIGSEKCTGDYIFRMDADDISVPERFEKQIAYIEKHSDIDVLGADISEFYVSPENETMRLRICPQKHKDIIRMGKKRNPMNHVTVCMKKSALQKCGGYETLLLLEDYYLWLKMIACGCKLENMHEALVYVRVGNGFDSKRGSKVRIAGWKKLQKFMLKHKLINKIEAITNMIYIIGFVYCPTKLKKLVYSKLLRKQCLLEIKMKIGIITHYNVHNHGALLQLYALKTVLEKENNDVRALTFKKNFDFMESGIDKKYDISVKSFFWYLSYICKIGLRRTIFNICKKNILDKFKKPMLGEYYSRVKNLDAVFIGSDEVFSIEAGVNPFFFGIGVPCSNIYTYAACCGPIDLQMIKQKHMEKLIKAGLEDIKKISVRDKNTFNIVCSLTNRDVDIVCDPVILYGYIDEIKNAERKIENDYLLIYAYDNNMNEPKEIKKIKNFAKKNKLKIMSAGFYHKWCDKCLDGSPIELLGYFKYAKYVITDTFHGSVMSLITNSEFVSKIQGNKNKLYDLLDRFELSERIIEDFDDLDNIFSKAIDYKNTNKRISYYRKKSMNYLKSCLDDVKIK